MNRTRKTLLALLLLALIAPTASQSSSTESDSRELHQALLDVMNPWTVMCVAAHPDDEDGATLTLLRRKYGVHTLSLFSTYGEGGQNAIGPELYEELGAIRARETEAAAKVQGSEPYFLALRDFGFSKSADEAFRMWGHDEALRRMVLKIRELQPDVIITNHDTVSGHGHHQATGRLVLEAFDAAADPARFPEQMERYNVRPWQVKRLFVRINYEGGTGSRNLEEEAERAGKVVSVNVSETDPVRNSTYAEQALRALHQHASQGPWPDTVPAAMMKIRYRLAREAARAQPLPRNAQTFLEGLELPLNVRAWLEMLKIDGRPTVDFVGERDRVLNHLANRRMSGLRVPAEDLEDRQRFLLMDARLNRAIAAAACVEITLTPGEEFFVPGSWQTFSMTFANNGLHHVEIFRESSGIRMRVGVGPRSSLTVPESVLVPPDAPVNVPHSEHLYDGKMEGFKYSKTFEIIIDDHINFSLTESAHADVAPPVEIESISPSPFILMPSTVRNPHPLTIRLINHQKRAVVERLIVSSDVTSGQIEYGPEFRLTANGTREIEFSPASSMLMANRLGSTQPLIKTLSFSVSGINRPRGNEQTVTRTIQMELVNAVVAPHLRVGYLRSFDYTLPNALAALGVENRELTIDEVRAGELSHFDTIIIDNRGYQAHPELIAANARLLEFVKSGGTLIVFYHKANEWNPDEHANRPQLAPYPIILGSARVTDEEAPVTFAEPNHALLNFPNKISAEDFRGWVQERGLYFPQRWDEHYSAPLAMSDANEPALRGGLLAADYGRGRYIYTSIVWYRQLRAGNPGGYRVFANMISYGRSSAR